MRNLAHLLAMTAASLLLASASTGCKSSTPKPSAKAGAGKSGSGSSSSDGDGRVDIRRSSRSGSGDSSGDSPGHSARRRSSEATAATSVDCGRRTSYDSDGDGISDPIEKNNGGNNYADLRTGRCDKDPSKPMGSTSRGELKGGLNLPDRGSGYRHYLGTDRVDSDDWGTLKTLACLEAVGRALDSKRIDMGVGDLSLRKGGAFPPHSSHQNGLDVDLRYVRRDRKQIPLDLRYQPDDYDLPATKTVFEVFFKECDVEAIFVDIDRIGFTVDGFEERLIHVRGHSNHFHVRMGDKR